VKGGGGGKQIGVQHSVYRVISKEEMSLGKEAGYGTPK